MYKKIWSQFQKMVLELPNDATLAEFLDTITEWFLSVHKRIDKQILHDYKTVELLYNISKINYPIGKTEASIDELRNRVGSYKPFSEDAMVMFLRNILWDLLVVRSTKECPRGDGVELCYLYDSGINEIILMCDICGWTQKVNGEQYESQNNLTIPTIEVLKNGGFM